MNNQLKLLIYILFVGGVFMYVQDSYDFLDISFVKVGDTKEEIQGTDDDVVIQEKKGDNYVEVGSKSSDSIRVDVEIADSEALRARGLSNRRYLGDYNGMLFVFDEKTNHPFWMKEMLISIDILFIDESGFIVDIKKSNEPCTDIYCPQILPSALYKYVLEVNAGFCEENIVQIGDRVEIHLASSK